MLAILYDVHGNLPALEAVLADAQAAGADRWVLGGDLTALGAYPAETAARLDALQPVAAIRGNWERWVADPEDIAGQEPLLGARRFVLDALGEALVARHGALPRTATVDDSFFCHASPRSDMEPFAAEADPGDAALLDGVREPRVFTGHTHLQFARVTEDGVEIINPGSVGLPLDGDTRAAYALLHDGAVELRRVAYDHEAVAATLDGFDAAWASAAARRLREARF